MKDVFDIFCMCTWIDNTFLNEKLSFYLCIACVLFSDMEDDHVGIQMLVHLLLLKLLNGSQQTV